MENEEIPEFMQMETRQISLTKGMWMNISEVQHSIGLNKWQDAVQFIMWEEYVKRKKKRLI